MITIVPYNPDWPTQFRLISHPIQETLGNQALAIHHIGSTSVPGLSAKNIIDIQVTVAALDKAIIPKLEAIGFMWLEQIEHDHRPPGRDDIPEVELTKFVFTRQEEPFSNLHVRVAGAFNQQYPLLCCDYLRSHPYAAQAYAAVKQQLAKHFPNDIEAYYDVKDPVFDIIMEGAYAWAKQTGWVAADGDVCLLN